MDVLKGSRGSPTMKRALLLPLVVLLVARVSTNSAQQEKPGFADANRRNEALVTLFPVNIAKLVSTTRLKDSTRPTSIKCSKQVKLLQEGLMNGTMWALNMIDASSKIPSGILMGNQRDLGMYDECVAIDVVEGGEELRGRHCMYNVLARIGALQLIESLSICMPASCESDDIQDILKTTLETVAGVLGVNITAFGVTCSAVEPSQWTAGGIVTLVGFSALLLFLIVCTVCDIFLMYSNDKSESRNRLSAIRQFSFYTNARRILSTKTTPQTLPALQGLRFFSMCWVILGHEYFMYISAPTVNLSDLFEWVSSWQSLYAITATFSVDTFFTISGFLMSYLFLKEMATGRSFNIFSYYIHRYLRLTPAFAAMILISIFILPRMGSGAIWEITTSAQEEICRKSWWSMLLYIHNYVNEGCLGHTWYLSVEMQYFWLSPLILYPLAKKPNIGLVILAGCFVASIVTPCKIAYDNKYTSAVFPNGELEQTLDTLTNFYRKSHNRASPWLVGILFGYLVFVQKGPSKKATKWIGWFLAIAAFAFCIFSMRKFQEKDYEYEEVWETFYLAVARPWWSGAVSWIIYACIRGFGGPVKTILSFSIFHPLSRLSYCVYLLHYVIQLTKIEAIRVPRFFSNFNAFDYFLSDLMLCLIIGFFFSLVFESPILVLEKLVRRRGKRKTDGWKRELKDESVERGIDNPGLSLH